MIAECVEDYYCCNLLLHLNATGVLQTADNKLILQLTINITVDYCGQLYNM